VPRQTYRELRPSPRKRNSAFLSLLRAKSNEGQGILSKITFIQRVDTAGGVAPAEGCDAGHAGAEVSADYAAKYYFFAAKP